MDAQTETREMPTESAMATNGRSTSERAADAGPTSRLNTSSAPTTGMAMVVASASIDRNPISTRDVDIPLPRRVRTNRVEEEWPEPHDHHANREYTRDRNRRDLGAAHAERLTEEEAIDLLRIFPCQAQEQCAEPQDHRQAEPRSDVMSSAATKQVNPDSAESRENGESQELTDAEEVGCGGAGKSAERKRMCGEGRASDDDKEADHARHSRDDC